MSGFPVLVAGAPSCARNGRVLVGPRRKGPTQRQPGTPARPTRLRNSPAAPSPAALTRMPSGRTSMLGARANELIRRYSDRSGRRRWPASQMPYAPTQRAETKDAKDRELRVLQSCGRWVVAFYNELRPHSALRGQTPGSITLPPCSPGSSPLRVACGDGLRPGLIPTARDGSTTEGRDGKTALDRTGKHRHDRPDGNCGLLLLNGGKKGLGSCPTPLHNVVHGLLRT